MKFNCKYVFWIAPGKFKHFFGNIPAYNCISYFLELFELHGIEYHIKTIKKDKVDINDVNIFLVPADGIPDREVNNFTYIDDFTYQQITGAALHQKENILWCYDNQVKVVIDRSRECVPFNIDKMIDWMNSHELIDYSYFRILINDKNSWSKHCNNFALNPKYKRLLLDADFFLFETYGLKNNPLTKDFNMKPMSRKKKYTFSLLAGEVRKIHRIKTMTGLKSLGLLDNSFYSTVNRYQSYELQKILAHEINVETYNKNYKYRDAFLKYKDELQIEKRFDSDDNNINLNNITDRKCPQEIHESYFNIVFESNWNTMFYTEKTYKPIICGLPFIILGCSHQNQQISQMGFIPYNNIFKFEFEEHRAGIDRNRGDKYIEGFIEEIKRVCSEPKEIFSADQIQYNLNHFEKIANTKSLMKHIEYTFESW